MCIVVLTEDVEWVQRKLDSVLIESGYIISVFAGTKVEGILRQSADVEEVERRVKEYEEGKFFEY